MSDFFAIISVKTYCGHTALVSFIGDTVDATLATKCCGGAVKFMDSGNGADVLCCKGCYQPVDHNYLVSLDSALEAVGCPCPEDCARETVWDAEQILEEALQSA